MAKRKKSNLQWIKETLDLKPDHRWEAPDGYRIFVANRGAVRFNVPQDWFFEPQEKSFKFSDKKPPKDDCALEVSFNQLPPNDWTLFPLKSTLRKVVEDDGRDVIEKGEIISLKRQTKLSGQNSNLSIPKKNHGKLFRGFALVWGQMCNV